MAIVAGLVVLGLLAEILESRNVDLTRGACALAAAVALGSIALDPNDVWRGQVPRESDLVVIGIALALAWIIAAVTERDRKGTLGVLGVVSAASLLFATSTWVAPSLLFWLCGSAALAQVALHHRSLRLLIQVAIPDALLTVALVLQVRASDSWALPEVLPGASFWLLVAAGAWRIGLVPWSPWDRENAALVPVLAGSGAVLLLKLGLRPEPWLATAAASVAAAAGALALFRPFRASTLLTFVSAVTLTTLFLAPPYGPRSAIAFVLACTGVALWTLAPRQSSVTRALAIAAIPSAALWVSVAGSIEETVAQMLANPSGQQEAFAAGVAGLGLISLVGIAIAARAAHAGMPGPRRGGEAVASWLVATACVGGGVVLLASGPWGPATLHLGGGGGWLLIAGLGAGAVAAYLAAGREDLPPLQPEPAMMVDQREPQGSAGRQLLWVAVGALVIVFGAAAVLTFQGLRVGFL